MEVDDEESKAIWIYFRRGSVRTQRNIGEIRKIFHKGDSLKDVIVRDVLPHLKICAKSKSASISASSLSSLSINGKNDESEKKENEKNGHKENDDDEKSDEDLLYEQVLETHSFG